MKCCIDKGQEKNREGEGEMDGVKVNDCTNDGENGSLFTVAWAVKQHISRGHSLLVRVTAATHTDAPKSEKSTFCDSQVGEVWKTRLDSFSFRQLANE